MLCARTLSGRNVGELKFPLGWHFILISVGLEGVLALWFLLIKLFKLSNRLLNFSRAIQTVRSNLVKKKGQAGCYINYTGHKSKGNMRIRQSHSRGNSRRHCVCQAAWSSRHLLHMPLPSYLMEPVFLRH